MSDAPDDIRPTDGGTDQSGSGCPYPALWPPRGSGNFGDYSVRDFAAKFLVQQDDFAELGRYRLANDLELSSDGERPSIVLIGDSITDFWPVGGLGVATGARLINRGIAGQNSSVMLLRFQADVIELAPAAVMVLAGTNDLRAYAGDPDALADSVLERLTRNLTAMADMATGRGIAVALATLPPVGGDLHQVARSPLALRRANASIARLASEREYPLADYHAALVDEHGLMPVAYSDDGIHPNAAGYARMVPVLIEAVEALSLRPSPKDPRP